jgi:D-glycero-alpha-D-manno-heptose-7-phosphate kinase
VIITQTPLRVGLLGGSTDFEDFYKDYGGAVLSTAIDKYFNVFVMERFDNKIVLEYTRNEVVENVKDIKHDLIREAMLLTGVDHGVEIYTHSDVPSDGTGLGSSSSVLVGLLHALHTYKGYLPTQKELAEQACHIEIDILKKPIGRQDQYIAAYGGLRLIKFAQNRIEVNSVIKDESVRRELSNNLLLFYTGTTRSSDSVLSDQKSRIEKNIKILQNMTKLAIDGSECLTEGSLLKVGRLLNRNWELKKMLSDRITNQQINYMYELAKDAGAIGGKVIGAGAGGFMLFYVEDGKKEDVREALKEFKELSFALEADGSKILFNNRRKI